MSELLSEDDGFIGGVLVAEEPVKVDDKEEIVVHAEKRAEECPIALVTLYKNIAEVRRIASFEAEVPGHYDIVIHGITSKARPPSVRATRGRGPATLLSITAKMESIPAGPNSTQSLSEFALSSSSMHE